MSNKGARGIDGMETGALPEWLERHWKGWNATERKTPQNRMKNLRKPGVPPNRLYRWGKSSASYCRIANNQVLKMAVNNGVLQKAG
jgi:hypothetical protein